MPKNVDAHQLKELKEAFDLFDADHSGTISLKELRKVAKSLGIHATSHDIDNLMSLMDKDGSGSVNFDEFCAVMSEQFYKKPSKKEYEEAFRYFDADNSGYITEEELFNAMSKFRKVSRDDIKKMIKAVDTDGNGKISINEFSKMMSSI